MFEQLPFLSRRRSQAARFRRRLIGAAVTATAEHVHTTTEVDLLSLLLDSLHSSSWGIASGTCSSRASSNRESRWVLDEGLVWLSLFEGEVLQLHGDRHKGLEGVGDGVWERRLGWVAQLQGDGSDLGHSIEESAAEHLRGDVKHGSTEEGSVVVDLVDDQTVGERLDVQLLQEGGLGGSDLVALLD